MQPCPTQLELCNPAPPPLISPAGIKLSSLLSLEGPVHAGQKTGGLHYFRVIGANGSGPVQATVDSLNQQTQVEHNIASIGVIGPKNPLMDARMWLFDVSLLTITISAIVLSLCFNCLSQQRLPELRHSIGWYLVIAYKPNRWGCLFCHQWPTTDLQSHWLLVWGCIG